MIKGKRGDIVQMCLTIVTSLTDKITNLSGISEPFIRYAGGINYLPCYGKIKIKFKPTCTIYCKPSDGLDQTTKLL